MKVLHVYRSYFPDPPGGLQEAIRQICISTQQFGIENTIFTLSPKPNPKVIIRPEATVVRCRSWAAPASCDLGGIQAFSTFHKLAEQADLIHYLFPWPFADLLRETTPRKPTVLTYISDIVRQRWQMAIYQPLMWRTLRRMDAIVSNASNYIESSPVLSHPSIKSRVRQIPLGINEHFYSEKEDREILARLKLNDDEPFFLFIGVFRYYKGLHTLLNACPQIQGKIVIAGSGPEEDALHAQATRMRLRNVIFTGQVTENEKLSLLKACRGLVLPSHLRSEAYGMVLVEASMFGKPMVSCDINTGTSFVNKHLETGFVVPPEAPDLLAQSINTLMANKAIAEKFGRGARRRYETYFNGRILGEGYSRLYKEILNK
jgi:glycosyltransferase involved in cell wall biosynthesis